MKNSVHWTISPLNKNQRLFWVDIAILYNMVKKDVVVLFISGSRATFLLSCVNQDTESG